MLTIGAGVLLLSSFTEEALPTYRTRERGKGWDKNGMILAIDLSKKQRHDELRGCEKWQFACPHYSPRDQTSRDKTDIRTQKTELLFRGGGRGEGGPSLPTI